MRRPGVFGGAVLIVIGLLFLGGNLGVLPPFSWALVGPVLLIALGLWVITMAFGRQAPLAVQPFAVPLEGARAARVVVRHGAGRLTIGAGAQPGMLADGSGAGGVTHRETRSSDAVTTELQPPEPAAWPGGALDWDLRLAEGVPLALQLHVGASENVLDLTRLSVTEFELETGASSTLVRLPASGVVKARVQHGAASVRLEVPVNVAARVVARGGLANIDVAPRFVRAPDGSWESPGFAAAADRVEITADVGVGELRVL